MTAALLLIAATVVVAEVGLRNARQAPPQVVAAATSADVQSLLRPSETVHHELRPSPASSVPPKESTVAADFRVNSAGCRGEEISNVAVTGTYRILVLGDDSICNPWVSEEATLTRRLGQLMQSQTAATLEIINGGVPGDCPLLSWLRFRHTLSALKPDLVILHFDMSDVSDDRLYRRLLITSGPTPRCPNASFTTAETKAASVLQSVRNSALASWAICVSQQCARDAIAVVPTDVTDEPYGWIGDDSRDYRIQISQALRPLIQLRDAVESGGGKLLVTSAPVLWQIQDGSKASEMTSHYRISGVPPYKTRLPFDVVRQFCEYEQIRFVDFVGAFESKDDPARLFSTSHPVLSEFGIALYAREIGNYLLANPPVHWPSASRRPEK
jgi:hypothetical protein